MSLHTKVRNRLTWLRNATDTAWDRWVLRVPQRAANPYATHVPVLIALARAMPVRRVLELGCGRYSTLTFLNRRAFPDVIGIQSLENDPDWAAAVQRESGDDARLKLVSVDGSVAEALSAMDLDGFDLILIDDSTTLAERVRTIRVVDQCCPSNAVVVIHDYELGAYRRAAIRLRRRFRFSALNPNTGVLWSQTRLASRQLRAINDTIREQAGVLAPDDTTGWLKHFQEKRF